MQSHSHRSLLSTYPPEGRCLPLTPRAPDNTLLGFTLLYLVPPALAEEARSKTREQSAAPGRSPWPLAGWPEARTHFVLCTHDRFFPPGFMCRVVAERLSITPDEIASGHCTALSRPQELADILAQYATA